MSVEIAIAPTGDLRVEAAEALPPVSEAAAAKLRAAFDQSRAAGLLLLAAREFGEELPPSLVFWRGLARELFQAVCQLGEESLDQWDTVPPPADQRLAQMLGDAPPMRGLEYLTADLLRSVWIESRELVAREAAACQDGPAAWLGQLNPLWHLLGRVTFHLAENKRDPDRPFAFLATYTHGLSGRARLKHLPLADALKTYAGTNQRDKLESLLEPVKRASQQSPLARELLDSKALFAPQAWSIRQAYRFLRESPQMEAAGVVVRLPDWWSARRAPRPQVQVQIGQRPNSQLGLDMLLDFQASVALDGQPLSDEERRQLLAADEGLVLLRGKWVEVDREQLQQALAHWKELQREHPDGISFLQGMRLLAGTPLGGDDPAELEANGWSRVVAGSWLRETLERLRQPNTIDGCQPGRELHATLRPYQVDGVRWLWFMTELGLGACLADDMGLGKTIQVIDLLLQRKREKSAAGRGGRSEAATHAPPSLLVVPASLVGNWRGELERFAPTLQVCFAHRSESDADTLARVAQDPRRELADFDLVVTTYGLARRQPWLSEVRWSLVVLDEAQAIKNAGSAQTRAVKRIPAAGRLTLTGTPVENHLGDLWSIFDFSCPGLLGSAREFKDFVKRLNQRQDAQAFGALRRLVRPYILRRMKTDPNIVPDLPEKTEMRAECVLSKRQAVLYEQAVEQATRRLKAAEGIARRGLVLSLLMQLKQICNHPAQYLSAESFPPEESGKFERLRLLCEPIAERQEKVLVFTQFRTLTEPLAEFLAGVFGRDGLVLHGGTPVKRRTELVRTFQEPAGPPFFVVSLKAGGSGLNLTAASHMVHFDRWWNPAVENQATDRAFRIGQRRNVLVHKFVCRGTVEERIDAMIAQKQSVADRLLDQDAEQALTEMNNDELLRFVAIDIRRATGDD